jgi:hypothetical protein
MKIYVIEFDNGCQYDDHENYTIGVYDTYDKAERFCLEHGYIESETKGLFVLKDAEWWKSKITLSIEECKMNLNFNEVDND